MTSNSLDLQKSFFYKLTDSIESCFYKNSVKEPELISLLNQIIDSLRREMMSTLVDMKVILLVSIRNILKDLEINKRSLKFMLCIRSIFAIVFLQNKDVNKDILKEIITLLSMPVEKTIEISNKDAGNCEASNTSDGARNVDKMEILDSISNFLLNQIICLNVM
jgi:hypothetical protein